MPAPSSEDLGEALVALVRGPVLWGLESCHPMADSYNCSRAEEGPKETAKEGLSTPSVYLEYSGFCDP